MNSILPNDPRSIDHKSGSTELPENFSRSVVLEKYWPEFFEIQKQERDKRLSSGWGIAKGLFEESLFWEWLIDNHKLEDNDAS